MTSTPESRSASSPTTDVVFGELGGTIVLIPRADANELAAVRSAVGASVTWGDLRARLSDARCAELAEAFLDEDQPADGVALADEPVPGWDDADWPEAPVQTMLDWVPRDVQELGTQVSTRLSGEHLELAPERTAEIVAAMEAAGYTMDRDDALVERAAWG